MRAAAPHRASTRARSRRRDPIALRPRRHRPPGRRLPQKEFRQIEQSPARRLRCSGPPPRDKVRPESGSAHTPETQVIPDGHPALRQLNELYGDHTFFLDGNGLNIVEPVESAEEEVEVGQVVNLAAWKDENPPTLALHEPEPTDVVVVLGAVH